MNPVMSVRSAWSSFTRLGLTPSTPHTNFYRIISFNNICLIAILINVVNGFINGAAHHQVLLLINIFYILSGNLSLFLTWRGYSLASRVLFLTSILAGVTLMTCLLGSYYQVQHFLLVVGSLTFLIFHQDERSWRWFFALVAGTLFVVLCQIDSPVLKWEATQFTDQDRLANQVSYTIGLIAALLALAKAYDQATIIINKQNKEHYEELAGRDRQLQAAYQGLSLSHSQLASAHGELSRNHALVRSMLNSIDEAFLQIDETGHSLQVASRMSSQMFRTDVEGKHLAEIFRIKPDARAEFNSWLSVVFMDRIDFADSTDLGPKVMDFDDGQILSLKYHPLRDQDNNLKLVIVTATDMTNEIKMARLAEEEKERSAMIVRIAENPPNFVRFLKDLHAIIPGFISDYQRDRTELRLRLHTLKGLGLFMGAQSVAKFIGEIELLVRDGREIAVVAEGLSRFKTNVETWLARESKSFNKLISGHETSIVISQRRFDEVRAKYSASTGGVVNRALEDLESIDLDEVLSPLVNHADAIAKKLGKSIDLRVEGEDIGIKRDAYADVFRSLIHVVNNCADHGIEAPAVRQKRGKPERGMIEIHASKREIAGAEWIRILISDDGGGIDTERLRKNTYVKTKIKDDTSHLDVAALIFDPGVSTKENITEISGHGVGMSAVAEAIRMEKGQIRICRTDRSGTEFEILLPCNRAS